MKYRDQGVGKIPQMNIGIFLFRPVFEDTGTKLRFVNRQVATGTLTSRKEYEESNLFYNFEYTTGTLDWNCKCEDRMAFQMSFKRNSDGGIAMVKDVKLTVTFKDDSQQIFTDLTIDPTNKYKEITGEILPLLTKNPTEFSIEDNYKDLYNIKDDKHTKIFLLPYYGKKWILCNTCNDRDHCIKPCTGTANKWCYLNKDSKGICTIDGNAEKEYTGQQGSPYSYIPCNSSGD